VWEGHDERGDVFVFVFVSFGVFVDGERGAGAKDDDATRRVDDDAHVEEDGTSGGRGRNDGRRCG
jgi:hypothetical protein